MNNNELGILLSAIIDKVESEKKINKIIKQIEVEAVKLNIEIDDKLAKSIAKDFAKQLANEQKKMEKEIESSYKLLADEKTRQEKAAYAEKSRLEKQELAEQKKMAQEIAAYEKQLANEQKRAQKDVLKSSELRLRMDKERFNIARQLQNYLKTNSRVMTDARGVKLSKIADDLLSGKTTPSELKTTTATIARLKAELNKAGLEGQNMWDKITGKYAEYGRFLLVSGSIALLKKSFSDMVQVVKELNQEFVNIQMVTGGTQRETATLMKTYNQMAQQLGSTTKEVSVSANEFLRQGLSIADTNKLIETSMVLSKVGMLSSADATQYLTSAMKGYKISAENALSIVDKVSTVDMVSATSASGLMEGMSRVANMADTVGFSMDRLLATLATIGEVTQRDMSSVGDSLRTMFARMSNIKVGKLVDSETQESLSDVETVLGNVGIKLRENETDFRNYGDILDEVAGRWASFNDVQRNSISTAFAGQRRIEDFLTLMNNYDNILAYTGESINSTGSAMKKFEIYQDGIEARTKSLIATFESLSQSVMNGNFLKGIITFGEKALGILNFLVKTFGTLPTLIMATTIALNAMGKSVGRFKSNRLTLFMICPRTA